MSEIEKMYKNAGIAKIGMRKCTTCEYLDCQNYCFISENNKCDKFSYQYPPFTAEKQIELIKWLARHNFVVCKNLGGWHTGLNPTYDEDFGITCKERATNLGSFEYALASLINRIWQDLTEEEKQQVKGILE